MKKLVLLVAVVTAVSFASCKKACQEAAAPEGDATEQVEEGGEEVVEDAAPEAE